MKGRVIFVERKPSGSVSIERVFRQIAKDLPSEQFDVEFQSVAYGNGILAILRNLLFFHPRPGDIYHVTGDIHYITLVLSKDRTVLTIHDLIFLHRRSGLRRLVLKKLFLDWPLRRLGQCTVVSQAIKDEILRYTGINGDKITVIDNPLVESLDFREKKPFKYKCPVILHIGTAENKNLARLIIAVRGMSCKLRIVGHLDDKMVQCLRINETSYENIFGLDENEMVAEYKNADIVSFCSTYEGFGLPIIEAQAMRTPIITSELAPMNSVAGGGAALVNPHDVQSIRDGLKRLINDVDYRNALVASGTENIKRFDGKLIACRYADIYQQVLDRTNQVR